MRITLDFDLAPLQELFERTAVEAVRDGVERGLYESASLVMARSQEIVPIGGPPTSPYDVAPGTLRDSGTVLLPEWEGDVCSVTLGYGGAASDYAAVQHEDLTFRHKEGQQAKFLEQPLDEEAPNVVPRIGAAIDSAAAGAR